ncbi:MAG: hypothetical protein Ct9H300mP28_03530 [Pseudomonadota bacterium]|nr:MAG: hypothetical protein Ct9H300mP28_03530 [Pseudomonadota bacterium]
MEYYFPHVKKHFNELLDNMEYSVVAELGRTDLSGTQGETGRRSGVAFGE